VDQELADILNLDPTVDPIGVKPSLKSPDTAKLTSPRRRIDKKKRSFDNLNPLNIKQEKSGNTTNNTEEEDDDLDMISTPGSSNPLMVNTLISTSTVKGLGPTSAEISPRKRPRHESRMTPPPLPQKVYEGLCNKDRRREILMSIFVDRDRDGILSLLRSSIPPHDIEVNCVIDDEGHTALHWATALSRLPILRGLLNHGADIHRLNLRGESALIRAVLFTNNFDMQNFTIILDSLRKTIFTPDMNKRTILHHIALTAGVRGRVQASKYYLKCLLDWLSQHHALNATFLNSQDKHGDTALNIAARIGYQYMVESLIKIGADVDIANFAGLKVQDYARDDMKVLRALKNRDVKVSFIPFSFFPFLFLPLCIFFLFFFMLFIVLIMSDGKDNLIFVQDH